jgi:hypothetical protein
MFARAHPGISQLTDSDIIRGIALARKSMKQNTLRRTIPLLKPFFTWLSNNHYNTFIHPAELDEIKAPGLDPDTKTASAMLSADEVKASSMQRRQPGTGLSYR